MEAKSDAKGTRKAEAAESVEVVPAITSAAKEHAEAPPAAKDSIKSKKPKAAAPKKEVELEEAASPAAKSKPSSKTAPKEAEDSVQQADDDDNAQRAAVGSGRSAAQGKAYKEKSVRVAKSDYVEVVEELECETEALALEQTSGKGIKRR